MRVLSMRLIFGWIACLGIIGALAIAPNTSHAQDRINLSPNLQSYQRIGTINRIDTARREIVIDDQLYWLSPTVVVWSSLNRSVGVNIVDSDQTIGYSVAGAGGGRVATVSAIWQLKESDIPTHRD